MLRRGDASPIRPPARRSADDRRALRSRAENQALQRGDLSAQILVLAVESKHHLGESRSVLGEIFRANRHVRKLHENARNRQQNKATQPTFVGRFVTFGTTRDHSERPSISIASCAPVTRIVPSRTGGQAKLPSSSHFVARTSPEPSKTRSFKQPDRFERNTKTSPLYGSPPNPSATSATRPCTPRRKSIGCVATHTRSPPRTAINVRPGPRPGHATASPHRHPA